MDDTFEPIKWPRLDPILLFLAGPSGAGKGLVAEHLAEEHRFARVSLADFCRREAERLGWPQDRQHLQAAGDRLRGTDPATLGRLAVETCTPAGALGIVVDGVRLPEEAQALRWDGFIGVGVSASDWTRAQRLRARGERWPVPAHPTEWEAGECFIDYLLPADAMESPGLLEVRVNRMLRWARERTGRAR